MKQFNTDLSKWKEYDYVVINDNLNKCYKLIMRLIKSKNKIPINKKFIKQHIFSLAN